MSVRYRELLIIAALLIATLIFGFVLIPLGIREGFGEIGPGLSPRFMPELATAGIAAALLYGLARYIFASELEGAADIPLDHEGGHPLRAVAFILICMFFAAVGFRVAGFYFGGIAMAVYAPLTLWINLKLLPKPFRPGPGRVAILAAISLVYVAFAIAATTNLLSLL